MLACYLIHVLPFQTNGVRLSATTVKASSIQAENCKKTSLKAVEVCAIVIIFKLHFSLNGLIVTCIIFRNEVYLC